MDSPISLWATVPDLTPVISDATVARIESLHSGWLWSEGRDRWRISPKLFELLPPDNPCPGLWESLIDIPVHLDSYDTLVLMGWNDNQAKRIHSRYRRQRENCWGILKFSQEFMENQLYSNSGDWRNTMTFHKCRQSLQDALMHEKHNVVRHTRNLRTWIEIILETNYYTLEQLDQRIQKCLDEYESKRTKQASMYRARRLWTISTWETLTILSFGKHTLLIS
ncbi:hypothetical protein BDV96DRAFT_199004 [Lophiotrema nucula]|uniref:Uncharacterized protein n=1 Tax=Lophiotrema nucula TaxID=690887 RepID=A0A6A5YX61_9PLEO|nr:hypothetical protein BDV96DRAFT_199004 [Lophiotrema nucula]